MSKLYIGTSGFSYKNWAEKFYPKYLPAKEQLDYYARHFCAVEINSSFYRLPNEKTLISWRDRVPDGFVFVLKASRYITHILRLQGEVKEAVDLFSNRVRLLGKKLGAVLYQLPPGLHKNIPRLENFLQILPEDIIHAIEFRHDSWADEETFSKLSKYRVSYCIVSAPYLKCLPRVTNNVAYVRFHGVTKWYDYNYSREELLWWAKQFVEFQKQDITVYAFFNNDANAYAAVNALKLAEYMKG